MDNETNAETVDTPTKTVTKKVSQTISKLLKKKSDDEAPEADMMSFAAIMTILLAFFIMLSSFAGKPKDDLAKEAVESFKAALKNFGLNRIAFGSSDSVANLTLVLQKLGVKSNEEKSKVVGKTISNLVDEEIKVEYERKGQQLLFPTKISFINGGLELSPPSKTYLDNLIKTIKERDCKVTICSYTDKDFVPTDEYPTSWQFSAEQAAVVAHYLNEVGKINYKRLAVIGYGKYQPLLGESSSFNTEANNRINIIVTN